MPALPAGPGGRGRRGGDLFGQFNGRGIAGSPRVTRLL